MRIRKKIRELKQMFQCVEGCSTNTHLRKQQPRPVSGPIVGPVTPPVVPFGETEKRKFISVRSDRRTFEVVA